VTKLEVGVLNTAADSGLTNVGGSILLGIDAYGTPPVWGFCLGDHSVPKRYWMWDYTEVAGLDEFSNWELTVSVHEGISRFAMCCNLHCDGSHQCLTSTASTSIHLHITTEQINRVHRQRWRENLGERLEWLCCVLPQMDAGGAVYGYNAADKAVIELIDDQADGDAFRVLSDPGSTQGPAPVPAPQSPAPTVAGTTSPSTSGFSKAELWGIGIGALSGFTALSALLFEVYKHCFKSS
jgi:hypothetical protein